MGVRAFAGKYSQKASGPGLKMFLWPLGGIQKFSIQTQNLEVKLSFPSKEGLNVSSEISILYKLEQKAAPIVLEQVGTNLSAI